MSTSGPESVLVGHISDGVLDAIRAQVRVAALTDKHIRVANVLQGALVSGRDSVGRHVAQRVLAVLIVHLRVLQDRDVAAIRAGEYGDTAKGQDDELQEAGDKFECLNCLLPLENGVPWSLPASFYSKGRSVGLLIVCCEIVHQIL